MSVSLEVTTWTVGEGFGYGEWFPDTGEFTLIATVSGEGLGSKSEAFSLLGFAGPAYASGNEVVGRVEGISATSPAGAIARFGWKQGVTTAGMVVPEPSALALLLVGLILLRR